LFLFSLGITEERHQFISVGLVSDLAKAKPGDTVRVGFLSRPDKGWHIYWKNPGDSGRSPRLKYKSSIGLGPSNWPVPKLFRFGTLANYGYDEPTVIFHSFTMPNTDVDLSLSAEWLVCEENCIPGNTELSLKIPVGETKRSQYFDLFESLSEKLPKNYQPYKVEQKRINSEIHLVVTSEAPLPEEKPHFFSNQKGQIEHAALQRVVSSGDSLTVSVPLDPNFAGDSLSGVLVGDFGGVQGLSIGEDPEVVSVSVEKRESFLIAILFAFIGGLILNLMPCVFPILSIKVLSLVNNPKEKGIYYTLGVLFSFSVLGGLFLLLKFIGLSLGWGFQLQYPPFVYLMIFLMFLVGLNLASVFEFGSSIQNLAGKAEIKNTRRGSFLTGVLATAIATPCTAPFMGTALASAVLLPGFLGFLVFLSLGLGLASPFLLLSLFPSLSRYLPRPGAWMERLKIGLAFPMFASVVWLLWVYGEQKGLGAMVQVLFSLVLAGFAAWIFGLGRKIVALILFSCALIFGYSRNVAESGVYKDNFGQVWESYSDELVTKYKREGIPMYIDFTASWCITCQVNKTVVFASKTVRDTIREKGIKLIRADWTSEDPLITRALQFYGSEGVPLNVVYNREGEYKILPTLLTPNIVLESIKED
jgi:thiol:disulfide interchange protein DsbD